MVSRQQSVTTTRILSIPPPSMDYTNLQLVGRLFIAAVLLAFACAI